MRKILFIFSIIILSSSYAFSDMRGINKVNIAIESFVNDKNENCSDWFDICEVIDGYVSSCEWV